MKNLVTGGAGFIGSHLIQRLLDSNQEVICLDNLTSGNFDNIKNFERFNNFKFIKHDIIQPIDVNIDKIWHLGCAASPKIYLNDPIHTSKTNFLGTMNMLNLATKYKAKFLFTSTSEIYGDPDIHPQNESYNGSVNNIGLRSCYKEGKRLAESLCMDYQRKYKTRLSIVRIFNVYGPKMVPNDGRVISNFISQALNKRSLTIFGNGKQTRSFCYIDDLINGLLMSMRNDYYLPINLGNNEEVSILELSKIIRMKINPKLEVNFQEFENDSSLRRKPNINLAKKILGWSPKIELERGLIKTIDYFKNTSYL